MSGKRPSLGDLTAFASIAQHRSFRKAADELGVSPSSLSHTLRGLEERLGVRLLNRTTRSVAVTDAGEALLLRLRPAFDKLDEALDSVETFRGEPRGTLRINSLAAGARLLLRAAVPAFRARHPEVHLDLVTDDRFVDIVTQRFDAGVRLGESVPEDMIAVRFGGDARFVAVASPRYLKKHGTPRVPAELAKHECIRHRMRSGKIYRWELERRGRELAVDVHGALTLDDVQLMAEAASAGLGIAFVPEQAADGAIRAGKLELVLGDWCPRIGGFALYYPGHRRVPRVLRAFIDVVRECESRRT